MKKILYLSILLLGGSIFFTSCEDDEKLNPIQTIENAAVVSFMIINDDINIGPTDTRIFSAEVDRQERVQSYVLEVTRTFNGTTTDPVSFGSWTANDFPFTMTIDTAKLANIFGINESEIQANDRFNFLGTTVDDRGAVYTIENFNIFSGSPELTFNVDGYEFEIRVIDE
ncbi:MAG: hypothetical protein KUG68_00005 [Flavobacteriaceae bacterium]|nr:hypothetical protein [Flavobacteriaceae bacterium]